MAKKKKEKGDKEEKLCQTCGEVYTGTYIRNHLSKCPGNVRFNFILIKLLISIALAQTTGSLMRVIKQEKVGLCPTFGDPSPPVF